MRWWVYVIIFIVTQLIGGGISVIAGFLGVDTQFLLVGSLLVANILAIVMALLMRPAGLTWQRTIEGWTVPERRHYTLKAMLMAPPAIFLVNIIGEWMPTPPDFVGSQTLFAIMNSSLGIITVCLLGPIAEELLFRAGVMGRKMQESEGFFPGSRRLIVLSALLFSLVHMNPIQMPGAFFLGLLLGWAYLGSRSLLAPCAIHIFNNSLAVVIALIYNNPDVTLTELLGNKTTVAITVAIATFWLLACFYLPLLPPPPKNLRRDS